MANKKEYIGVFDSGVGGISVLKELMKQMPEENYLYYGDNANAPYGVRSTQQVRELTLAAAKMLFDRGVKALVVACNTATAAAIKDLRQSYPDKVIIGIEPALKLAADHYPTGRVGVMATPVTLREEKFAQLSGRFPQMQVHSIPAPGLVELIEAGEDTQALETFLTPILKDYVNRLDAVVLGCTHYPFAAAAIKNILGEGVKLLDGGKGTAMQTRRRLEDAGLLSDGPGSLQIESSSADPEFVRRAMALLEENFEI